MKTRLAVDVGGTFTDFVYMGHDGVRHWKVLTTPSEPWKGILGGIEDAGLRPGGLDFFINATTLGTNLFFGQTRLERPRVVLITNRGFEDVLEIGRQNRPSLYDPFFQRPPPLVDRRHRIGVKGRVGSRGEELEPLDEDEVARAAAEHCGPNTVFAVSFLHSYANPEHELRAKEVIHENCPQATVVASHEVDPLPMEYERTSTTVVNALLTPIISAYLERLDRALRERGFTGRTLAMQSSGGLVSLRDALRMPAAFIESGPAAGAVAVAVLSREMGIERALGFDMGGTTAKASSIVGGRPTYTDLYEVGGRVHMGRPIPGSGYPVRYTYIDLAEVSAGGGTIAWVDKGGALRVGPLSSGADPGPACYARGGMEPTVTDANVVLGRLPSSLAGGRLRLDRRLAAQAVGRIAERLGRGLVETALDIISHANVTMARALRVVSVEKGLDPAEFTLFAFGGAGPLHAVELARELGVGEVVVPPLPGVFSALGLLLADYKLYYKKPVVRRLGDLDLRGVEEDYREMEERARRDLEAEGFGPGEALLTRWVEARYVGQSFTLTIPYTGSREGLEESFHRAHEARYGFSSPDEMVEVVSLHLDAVGVFEKPDLRQLLSQGGSGGDAVVGSQRLVDVDGVEKEAALVEYGRLPPGGRVDGPALVVYPDSTVFLPQGSTATRGEWGELRIKVG